MADLVTDAQARYRQATVEDYDRAIRDWFLKTVDAAVTAPVTGENVKVPVQWSAGERWAVSRQRKAFRDDKGVLILPIIALRRTGIETDPSMKALGVETGNIAIAQKISQKTGQLQQDSLKRIPSARLQSSQSVYEITTIPFPRRGIVVYDLLIHAQYTVQMNEILQKIMNEMDHQKCFVAPFDNNGYHPQVNVSFDERKPLNAPYAVGFMESTFADGGNFEEFTDQERIVKYSTTIRVPAAFVLDTEGEKPARQVQRTPYKVAFDSETIVESPEDIDKIFGTNKGGNYSR